MIDQGRIVPFGITWDQLCETDRLRAGEMQGSQLTVTPVIYAIDVGDSYMRGGYFVDGLTHDVAEIPTPRATKDRTGEENLLTAISAMVDEIRLVAPSMQAFGLSCSGIMTLRDSPGARSYGPFKDKELLVLAPNVDGLKYVPILSRIEQLGWGVPVHVENDCNAALTAATTAPDAVSISLGGGLGAAIKREGIVQHPEGTWSCYEIGHGMRWPLPEHLFRTCHCGNNGCLEAVIGGWAMTERYRVRPENAPPDIYASMMEDVIEFLPPAIASLIESSGIHHVVLSGLGCMGYSENPEFVPRLGEAVEKILADGQKIEFSVVPIAETAELHGVALALLANGVVDQLTANE